MLRPPRLLPRAAVLAAALSLLVPGFARAAASVSLQPAAGPAGSLVTLRGAGLPARRAATVRVGSRKVRVVADRRGRFVARVRIPQGAKGRPALITRAAGLRIANHFAVMGDTVDIGEVAGPGRVRLRWMPVRAQAGSPLALHGVGLPRHRRVLISLAGKRVAAVRSTRAGRFATVVTAPTTVGALVGVVRAGRLRLTFALNVLAEGSAPSTRPPASPASGTGDPAKAPAPAPVGPAPDKPTDQFPIRAAFYYPWFPETWGSGSSKYTHYHPTAGYYSSDDTAVIARQLDELRYGRVDAAISSWWGQGHSTDRRLSTLLSVTHSTGSPIKWAIYYENEGWGNPSPAQLASDLAYLRDKYASDPSYLKVGGRFVVFAYGDAGDNCSMVDRWRQANAGINAYLVLKIFPGYTGCAAQPDAWHEYAPAVRETGPPGQSFAVSPGFWLASDSSPRLNRDPGCFRQAVRDMVASGAPWQLVTTFDEWGEGTSVEPASEWQTPSGYGAYLDALHDNGAGAAPGPPC
ncbi:MAG: hypothetical protein E6G10_05380 [Actinobacteria bacterium]|nr:MAG: hypothetical protein E6G10_05380 [Actinomycetota bacterium]